MGLRERVHRLVGDGGWQQEVSHLNLTPVVCRDTPSWVEEGCVDPDQRQRGKSGVSKREARVHQGAECPSGTAGPKEEGYRAAHATPTWQFQGRSMAQGQGPLSMAYRTAKVLGHSGGT